MVRKLLLLAFAAALALAALLVYRTIGFVPRSQPPAEPLADAVDADAIAQRLARAVRFETVSPQPPQPIDAAQFEGFVAWLAETYPLLHAKLEREVVGGHTLVFRWPGRDAASRPALLTAHYDVTPVTPGTEKDWTHPPFGGEIADGYVWGRGTLDDKGAVITILEAVTALLAQGYEPGNTLYLVFGHDEEIGGRAGAAAAVAHLKANGVRFAWSLDEGSFVLDGMVPGVTRPVASINVAEKGVMSVELVAQGMGGHSSMPPPQTAIGVLAGAIVRVQQSPLPGGLDGISGEFMDAMAREMSFDKRLLFANRWIFAPLLEHELAKSPSTNALLRTTTAPTMVSGGVKENALPLEARAIVNFRVHPRDTTAGVVEHVKRAVADERVTVTMKDGAEASAVSASDSAGFRAMGDAARRAFGDVAVAPGLTIGATDSKHYGAISDNAYRFHPMKIRGQDLAGFHGTNERVSIDNLARATRFYMDLIRSEAR